MDFTVKKIEDPALEGLLISTPTRQSKSDTALWIPAGVGSTIDRFIREDSSGFSVIEFPEEEAYHNFSYWVTPEDEVYLLLTSGSIYSDVQRAFRWSGSWELIGQLPGYESNLGSAPGDQPTVAVHNGQLYLCRNIVPLVAADVILYTEVYTWDGSWDLLFTLTTSPESEDVGAGILLMDILGDEAVFIGSEFYRDGELLGGILLKAYAGSVGDTPTLASRISIGYPSGVESGLFFWGGLLGRTMNHNTWLYQAPYEGPSGEIQGKNLILQWDGDLQVVKEWWSGEGILDELHPELPMIPAKVGCPGEEGFMLFFNTLYTADDVYRAVGGTALLSDGFQVYPELSLSGVNGGIPPLDKMYMAASPTFDGESVYVSTIRWEELTPVEAYLGELSRICPLEPRKVPMRSGPVSRIVNLNTAKLQILLTNLRDIEAELTEGDLTLDANGYRISHVAPDETSSSIKLRS